MLKLLGVKPKNHRAENNSYTVAFFTIYNGIILGTDRLFIDIVDHLSNSIRPIVFVLSDSDKLRQSLGGRDIPIYEVPVPLYPYTVPDNQTAQVSLVRYVRYMRWIYLENSRQLSSTLKIFARENVDLVHSLTSVILLGSLAASRSGLPHIWHTGETILHQGWKQKLWIAYMQRRSDAIVAVSNRTARDYGSNAVVLHSGVKVRSIVEEYANAETESLAREYSIESNDLVMSCVGTIQRTKGQLVLVKAMAKIRRTSPDLNIKLFLVGPRMKDLVNDDYFNQVEKAITDARLSKSIILTGYRSDYIRFNKLADIIVHPTATADSYPAAILSAMLCGKPIIASDCGGIPEMITDHTSGILVAPNNVTALSEAIELLADDATLRQHLSRNAYRFGLENFDGYKMSTKLEKLYCETIRKMSPGD